jgi:hypothetical protein
MKKALLLCGSFVTASVLAIACGGSTKNNPSDAGTEGSSGSSSGGSSGSSSGGVGPDGSIPPHGPAQNVDLLFMIDNSASMGDKQSLLGLAIPVLIQRLVTPNCVDASGNPIAGVVSDQSGNCAMGKPEFAPAKDLHIGIVTSSLGGRGGDQCPDNATNPAAPSLSAHTNDKGELINRAGVRGDPTIENPMPNETAPDNFLAYFPGSPMPANAVTNPTSLVSEFSTAVLGVHEHGCGFEAQNEAWYRFLVQPDPFNQITKGSAGGVAVLQGVDETILQQRADFLRPDSLLAVIVVTDENEEAADPLAIQGQGWAFDNTSFPGSPNSAAPEGTIECGKLDPNNPSTTGPNDPNCTSCAFLRNDPSFAARCPNDAPGGTGGYLDPSHDALNIRFLNQKERFGLFAGYPTSRYVRGLQQTKVPSVGLAYSGDTDHEHDAMGNYVGDQNANCVNPIYAQKLPTSTNMELCHLQQGPRTPDMVYYAAIAGVPHQLLQQDPTNPMSPQKATLSAADWKRIMGNDPEHYDFSGADFHMIESTQDRTTMTTDPSSPVWANHSNCPDTAADNCDPINGREYQTNKSDLQFACIFPLINVDPMTNQIVAFQKDCTSPGPGDIYKSACNCATGALNAGTPLCQKGATGYTQVEIAGKAYPSIREMIIAHAMATSSAGTQGFVSSVCPIVTDIGQPLSTAQQDPLFGYNPGINAIVEGIKKSFVAYP